MKAKKIRPFLIVLLFGILSASGWLIFSGGAHRAGAPALTAESSPPGARAHGPAAGPSARPSGPASGIPFSGGLYAQSAAAGTPPAGSVPHGASGNPTAAGNLPSAADPPADPRAGSPILIAADDAYDTGWGFGGVGLPGALPAADASNPRGGGRPGSGASTGSGDSGKGGGSGGSSGAGTSSLLDPPGATGGGSGAGAGAGAGGDPAGSSGNHQVTVPEPSTLALFLAGTTALGFALRRRRLRG